MITASEATRLTRLAKQVARQDYEGRMAAMRIRGAAMVPDLLSKAESRIQAAASTQSNSAEVIVEAIGRVLLDDCEGVRIHEAKRLLTQALEMQGFKVEETSYTNAQRIDVFRIHVTWES